MQCLESVQKPSSGLMGQSMDAFIRLSDASNCNARTVRALFPSMPGAIWQTPLPCGVNARIINFSDAKPGDWDDLLSRGVCFISLDVVPV
jgi:hypothetical protein